MNLKLNKKGGALKANHFLTIFILLFLCSCSSTKHTYKQIADDRDTYTTRSYHCSLSDLHKAVTQVLLTKKFIIENEDVTIGTLNASRFFSKGYQTIAVVVQSKILSKNDKEQHLFLNAIQTTERNYVADRTRFLLFLIPLPGGGGKEVTKSKESEFVINDKSFYDDLFTNIEKAMGT